MPETERSTEQDIDEPTVVLSGKDAREAARLLQLLSDAIDERTETIFGEQPPSRAELIVRARTVLRSRQLRATFFNRAMFGEPAWDVLLALYITEKTEGRQSVGRIAELIEIPLTTVARWIEYLEKERLVGREAHPSDKRVMFIRLLHKGRELLESYLAQMPWISEKDCR